MKKLLLIPILAIGLPSCFRPQVDQTEVIALMESTLQEKLDAYRQRMEEDCQKRILKEAARVADSIIVEEARLYRDTVQRPPIPPRPERPETKKLPDSLPVGPLISRPDTVPQPPTDSAGGQ